MYLSLLQLDVPGIGDLHGTTPFLNKQGGVDQEVGMRQRRGKDSYNLNVKLIN